MLEKLIIPDLEDYDFKRSAWAPRLTQTGGSRPVGEPQQICWVAGCYCNSIKVHQYLDRGDWPRLIEMYLFTHSSPNRHVWDARNCGHLSRREEKSLQLQCGDLNERVLLFYNVQCLSKLDFPKLRMKPLIKWASGNFICCLVLSRDFCIFFLDHDFSDNSDSHYPGSDGEGRVYDWAQARPVRKRKQ